MRAVTALVRPDLAARWSGVYPGERPQTAAWNKETARRVEQKSPHTLIVSNVNGGTQLSQVLQKLNEVLCSTEMYHSLSKGGGVEDEFGFTNIRATSCQH